MIFLFSNSLLQTPHTNLPSSHFSRGHIAPGNVAQSDERSTWRTLRNKHELAFVIPVANETQRRQVISADEIGFPVKSVSRQLPQLCACASVCRHPAWRENALRIRNTRAPPFFPLIVLLRFPPVDVDSSLSRIRSVIPGDISVERNCQWTGIGRQFSYL